jgi:hypothetical protein
MKNLQAMRIKTLVEDSLDGSNNFSSRKSRLHITREESDLLKLIEGTLPATTIDEEKDELKTDDVKARKIIIYSITKDDTTATLFMNISEIRDQLGSIGETITDRELFMINLNVLASR